MADKEVAQEPLSYDADMMADVRGAFTEVSEAAPAVDKAADKEAPAIEAKAPEPKEVTPTDPKADHPTDKSRYADGTFKATKSGPEKAPEPGKIAEVAKAPEVAQQQAAPVQAAPATGSPPPGWSVKSKTEWDKLPEHIRADIAKREQEVSAGFAEYAGMKELKPYVEMAKSRGQTLKSALDHYVGIENLLAQNPIQGLLQIARNIGFAPERLAMELSPLLGQSNGQPGQMQGYQQPQQGMDPNLMQMLSPLLSPLQQEVTGLKSLLQQQHQAAQARELGVVNNTLERFMADPAHRYFANLEPQIIKLFEGGVIQRTGDYSVDLKAAYDLACRMDPEISEALFNERRAKAETDRLAQEKEAAEKARQASRSITGSPTAGGKDIASGDDDSIEETVRKAYRAHAA